ncbi:MAG: hypothetical protein WC693_02835 [Patescibacteria group bacterium]|jgi:hypothetical protein
MTVQLLLINCATGLFALILITLLQTALLKRARNQYAFFCIEKRIHFYNFAFLRVFQLFMLVGISFAIEKLLVKGIWNSLLEPWIILIQFAYWLALPSALYYLNYRWEFRNSNFCRRPSWLR